MMTDERTPPAAQGAAGHGRFQFGLKHLLALPVLVAGFGGSAGFFGIWGGCFFVGACAVGACFLFLKTWAQRVCAAVFVILLCLVVGNALFSVHPHRSSRATCMSNLKQIALALIQYDHAYGCLPPAYVADEDGRPMHSWRVLILPFLDRRDIYNEYDFEEPWWGPNNRKLADLALSVFNCPAETKVVSPMTNYVAVVGAGTAWPGSESTACKDFADGRTYTILLVEVKNSGIHWMEPRDLQLHQMPLLINPPAGLGISSHHVGGVLVAYADGRVTFLRKGITADELRAALTIAGGDPVDPANF